jgi:hypothetical protein
MTRDQQDDSTMKAISLLIDALPAPARAILREKMIEAGVTLPERQKPGRNPRT